MSRRVRRVRFPLAAALATGVLLALTLGQSGCVGVAIHAARMAARQNDKKEGREMPAADSRTVRIGAYDRHYLVYTPPSYGPGGGLLIVFHPSNSTGQKMRLICGAALEREARRDGFVVAYPDGYEGHFDDCRKGDKFSARTLHIDDVAFARAIVAVLGREKGVDRERVWALGYSNGGAMALRLALETPDLVSGVVSIAANLPTADNLGCSVVPGRRVRVALIEGTDDPLNPYVGGEVSLMGMASRGRVLSAQASAGWFVAHYQLSPIASHGPTETVGDLRADWQDWGSPDPMVRLITVHGGGHTVPQADRDLPDMLGPTFRSDVLLDAALAVAEGR